MPKRRLTDDPTFNGYPINTRRVKSLKCDVKILQRLDDLFEQFQRNHDRTFFMRYDIRFPKNILPSKDNQAFRRFQGKFIKYLRRKDYDPHYLVVREQSNGKKQHYHGVLLLDERKVNRIEKVIEKADQYWSDELGIPPRYDSETNERIPSGLVDDCTKDRDGNKVKNGVIVKMRKKDKVRYKKDLGKCFYRSSYLAKENQKQSNPNHTREMFSSRITYKKKMK